MEDHHERKKLRSAAAAKEEDELLNCRMTLRSAFKPKLQQGEGKRQINEKESVVAFGGKARKKKKPVVNKDPIFMRNRYREFTFQEREAYRKKIEETGGFDVGDVPKNVVALNLIRPSQFEENPQLLQKYNRLAKQAPTHFNRESGKSYQYVKLIRMNLGRAAGTMHYITFQAKDKMAGSGSPPQTFQAIVRTLLDETDIVFCRFEQKSKLPEGPGETSQP